MIHNRYRQEKTQWGTEWKDKKSERGEHTIQMRGFKAQQWFPFSCYAQVGDLKIWVGVSVTSQLYAGCCLLRWFVWVCDACVRRARRVAVVSQFSCRGKNTKTRAISKHFPSKRINKRSQYCKINKAERRRGETGWWGGEGRKKAIYQINELIRANAP